MKRLLLLIVSLEMFTPVEAQNYKVIDSLDLRYNIITKEHNEIIRAESNER